MDSELVIGIVGAVGTESSRVIELIENRLKLYHYDVLTIKVSRDVIQEYVPANVLQLNEFQRISQLMDAGNNIRKRTSNNAILALGAIREISAGRRFDDKGNPIPRGRQAYIIDSLKHPEEVEKLRQVYAQGFYLVGIHSDDDRRIAYLTKEKKIPEHQARSLIDRDGDERLSCGQKVTDTFHLSDVFVRIDGDDDRLKGSVRRIVEILMGQPYRTPSFDEYAMFLAFAASLRSADLSRQVGAVIASNGQIVAMGANDCPRFGGGLYWPEEDSESKEIIDRQNGRDHTRGFDSNKREQSAMITEIVADAVDELQELLNKHFGGISDVDTLTPMIDDCLRGALRRSKIRDITEFGRVVHAEMDAMLSCARSNVSTQGATIYCTTFPCHNCAKHIIAAGIKRVVYIEPYQKSKAGQFHDDSIFLGFSPPDDRVTFEPFVGVGPRRFFDLFSMKLGSGYELIRKDDAGSAVAWTEDAARLRLQMYPGSYLDLESMAVGVFEKTIARS